MPEISAIMPVYNGEKHVKETMESILAQTWGDFELIVVNDGSTDRTKEIIESFNDSRIRSYHLPENKGVGYASHFALMKAKGRLIARVDADDLYHPDRFLLQKRFLDEHSDISLVKSWVDYFPDNEEIAQSQRYYMAKNILEKQKNQVNEPEEIAKKLYWFMCVPHTSIMVRSPVIKRFGYQPLRICEDYQLLFRMNQAGCRMGTLKKKLVKFRISSGSTTATQHKQLYEAVYQIKREIIEPLFFGGKVHIWGGGAFGKLLCSILKKNGRYVDGFIDSDIEKQNNSIDGKRIISPQEAKRIRNLKVIIASQIGMFEIAEQLESWGFKHLRDYIVFF